MRPRRTVDREHGVVRRCWRTARWAALVEDRDDHDAIGGAPSGGSTTMAPPSWESARDRAVRRLCGGGGPVVVGAWRVQRETDLPGRAGGNGNGLAASGLRTEPEHAQVRAERVPQRQRHRRSRAGANERTRHRESSALFAERGDLHWRTRRSVRCHCPISAVSLTVSTVPSSRPDGCWLSLFWMDEPPPARRPPRRPPAATRELST